MAGTAKGGAAKARTICFRCRWVARAEAKLQRPPATAHGRVRELLRALGPLVRIKGAPAERGGLAIHFRDITERKLAELALAESEERLRLAQQGAKAGLWDRDLVDGQITWSAEYYEIFGFDPAIPPSVDQFVRSVHPEDRQAVEKAVNESVALAQAARHSISHSAPAQGSSLDLDPRTHAGRQHRSAPRGFRASRSMSPSGNNAEENLRFLSETGVVLSSLVDFESTMQKIARLAVPFFADWCVVNIFGQFGEAEYVAFAHRLVAKEAALEAIGRLRFAGPAVRRCSRCNPGKWHDLSSKATCAAGLLRRDCSRCRASPAFDELRADFVHRCAAGGPRAHDRLHDVREFRVGQALLCRRRRNRQ